MATDLLLLSLCCCLLLAGIEAAAVASRGGIPTKDDPYYDYKGKEMNFGKSDARMTIHSGTKWCGAGNIANNFSDLGSAFETDKCCRQHDYCGVYLLPNEKKYNFKNDFYYTISHCECDNNFLNCLQASRDAQARSVYYYFFYSLKMPCFSIEPRHVCVHKTWWDKIVNSCSRYGIEDTAVLMRLPQITTPGDVQDMPNLKFRSSRK